MTIERRDYADGTYTIQTTPWGFYRGGMAMCVDGKVRRLKRVAETADTFFSVPAAVRAEGKTVAGYITVEARSGSSVVTDDDPAIVRFIAYTYGKNGGVIQPLRREPICTSCWNQRHPDDRANTGGPVHGAIMVCQDCGGLTSANLTDAPKE